MSLQTRHLQQLLVDIEAIEKMLNVMKGEIKLLQSAEDEAPKTKNLFAERNKIT